MVSIVTTAMGCCCSGTSFGLNSKFKEKWEFVIKEEDGSQWVIGHLPAVINSVT